MREKVVMVCSECQARNYYVSKRKDNGVRLEMNKFCPKCGKHTLHKEGK